MSNHTIIGLTGRARAGKTQTADIILQRGFADFEYAFAQPVKQMLAALGIDPADPYWEQEKTTPIPMLGGKSYRDLMQTLGTEWGRNLIHEDIWVIQAENIRASLPGVMLVSDVRFDNEAEFIKRHGGLLLEITTEREGESSQHISEQGISRHLIDLTVANDGTLVDLETTIVDLFNGNPTRK